MTSYDVMPDFTHSAVPDVPDDNSFGHVAGYTSGTSNIVWTEADWDKYANKIRLRIEQGYGSAEPDVGSYDYLDVENGAWTPATAAQQIQRRVEAGYVWTGVYGSDSTLESVATAVKALGNDIWVGHVYCVLANWNLDETEAAAILGTEVHGMTCNGVQWASPTSNPDTRLPGTNATLAQVNADLNVVPVGWAPPTVPRGTSAPTPPAAPPAAAALEGFVVYVGAGGAPVSVKVSSSDAGKSWA
jgi:hypothetical protein